jgi:Domain of unknown function (DUF932)
MNSRRFQNRPLSNEELREIVPSAFATEPWQGQSSRYAFVPTSRVIEGMREAGFLPYSAIQSSTRVPGKADFTKHLIRFRPENITLANLGDTAVETILTNSHDGTSQYEVGLGAFRLACLNGLLVAETLAEIFKVRHTGNIIHDVIEATQNIIERAPVVAEAIQRWKTIDLKPTEARVLAEEAHSLRFDANSPVTPDNLLKERRSADSGTDLWTVFNRIQENTVSGGVRTYIPTHYNEETGRMVSGRRVRTREIKGIAENSKLNRALWSLAEKMAELKTA